MELTAYFHGICNINAPEETTIKPKKQQKKKQINLFFFFCYFHVTIKVFATVKPLTEQNVAGNWAELTRRIPEPQDK